MQTLMSRDVYFEPQAVKSAYDALKSKTEKVAASLKKEKIAGFAVAARGSSLNACQYFKYLSEIRLGIPVTFLNPSVVSKYGAKINLKNYAVFAVSQSGKAQDIYDLMTRAKESGAKTFSVTNTPKSPLARDFEHFYLNAGEEKSVAATKTFIAQMTFFSMFVEAFDKGVLKEETSLPQLINAALKTQKHIDALAAKYVDTDSKVFVLSRGIGFVTAAEIGLKLKETCYVNASVYPMSEFQHGPLAVLDKTCTVILFADSGANKDGYLEMIQKIKDTGSKLVVFADDAVFAANADDFVLLPKTEEVYAPFAGVVAGQLFACKLSQLKGINPDNPRGLKKVTVTV